MKSWRNGLGMVAAAALLSGMAACAPTEGPGEGSSIEQSNDTDEGSSGATTDGGGEGTAAGNQTGGSATPQAARLSVLLTDAPGDFEAVPVTIASVEAFLAVPAALEGEEGSGGAGGSAPAEGQSGGAGAGGAPAEAPAIEPGWRTLVDTPAEYDLLQLQNGVTAALGHQEIPPGVYTQLRLIVSEASVVVDGEVHDLKIPSGSQTGLKLNYDFDLSAAGSYELVLDFDAHESVKKAGPKYLLTPVIRVQSFGAAPEAPTEGEGEGGAGASDPEEETPAPPN